MTRAAIAFLFDEVLHGTAEGNDGTYFVQGNEALLATCASLTSAQASWRPASEINSIAAHLIHSNYYLELALRQIAGEVDHGDWAGSWKKQTVTDAEWAAEQKRLRGLAERFHAVLAKLPVDNEDAVTGAIANVGHLAYHLGAIRVLAMLAANSGH